MKRRSRFFISIQRYFLTGVLTAIPLFVTWLLVDFLLDLMRSFGEPVVRWFFNHLLAFLPSLSSWLIRPWLQAAVAVVMVVLSLILIGWLATRYIGRRFLVFFDSVMNLVPLVRSIYGSVKKLLDVIQTRPDGVQRVVLIDFPSRDMKTVGIVTRTLVDEDSGRILAAVYVPTTPNPTSGFLEIVPLENVTSTNWSFDEAMSFIMSGGAVAPSRMNYDKSTDLRDLFEKDENED